MTEVAELCKEVSNILIIRTLSMRELFKDLTRFQKAEFIIMMLLALAIPFSWRVAQYLEAALFVCALLKLAIVQRFRLNPEQKRFKWAYIVFMSTWLIYLIGMLYTDDVSVGWAQVSKKLGFLIFPMVFLFSDMSYLTRERFRAIAYSLVAGCIGFFLMNLGYAIYDVIFCGAGASRFFDQELMKLYYVHHSYLSMYAGFAMTFCFMEFFETESRRLKLFNILSYIFLALFIILLRSRAGLLCTIILFALQWVWLAFIKRQRRNSIIIASVFIIGITASCIAFPQSLARITNTIKDMTTEHHSDHRMVQFKGYKELFSKNLLFGVGTGDRTTETQAAYHRYKENIINEIAATAKNDSACAIVTAQIEDFTKNNYYEPTQSMREFMMELAEDSGCDPDVVNKNLVDYLYINYAIDKEINAHNMFLETIISVGIIGLALLLAYFIIPLVIWIKRKSFDMLYFSFLMIIAFNGLFESVNEGQVGIIFFCFFNSLLFHISFIINNKKQLS